MVMVTRVKVEDIFTETNVVLLHGIKRILPQYIKWNLRLTFRKTCTHILPSVNILQFYTSALNTKVKRIHKQTVKTFIYLLLLFLGNICNNLFLTGHITNTVKHIYSSCGGGSSINGALL